MSTKPSSRAHNTDTPEHHQAFGRALWELVKPGEVIGARDMPHVARICAIAKIGGYYALEFREAETLARDLGIGVEQVRSIHTLIYK